MTPAVCRFVRVALATLFAVDVAAAAAQSAAPSSLLPPERAFRFSARALAPDAIEARFHIADGYYLYRDKMRFRIEPASAGTATAALPAGKVKDDEFFGRVETYRGDVIVPLAVRDARSGERVAIVAESQGCADAGVCYPPTVQRVTIVMPDRAGAAGTEVSPRQGWFD